MGRATSGPPDRYGCVRTVGPPAVVPTGSQGLLHVAGPLLTTALAAADRAAGGL
ncbi:hypothetical protein [Streptomyces sp. HUAS TT3]|uniref:hypothetical protein n=1 Tax=Streptomyces sp. HUAS TT3 TaxID=3447510 RepID=UPI003F65D62C